MQRCAALTMFSMTALTAALTGCGPDEPWFADVGGDGDYFLQAENGRLEGSLGDVTELEASSTMAEAFYSYGVLSISVHAEGPDWVAMSGIVMQGDDSEAIFVPGTRLFLVGTEDESQAIGCSGVGPAASYDYEDTPDWTEILVSEGSEPGTVIVTFWTTYSSDKGQQTLEAEVEIAVPE